MAQGCYGSNINGNYQNANVGADVWSCGYDTNGNVYINNSSVASLASWSAGANISVALDTVNRTIWFRVNGGNWNNNTAYDPATNTGGIDVSGMPGGNYYPAFGSASSAAGTAAFLSAAWTYSAPSGFAAMSDVAPVERSAGRRDYQATSLAVASPVQRNSTPTQRTVAFTAGAAGSPLGSGVSVSGTVQELGVNVSRKLYVYDHSNGELLDTTTSDGSTGAFTVLARSRNQVFVVAMDPTTYQAQVYDRITPA